MSGSAKYSYGVVVVIRCDISDMDAVKRTKANASTLRGPNLPTERVTSGRMAAAVNAYTHKMRPVWVASSPGE